MHATSDNYHTSVEGILNDCDFGQVDRVGPHVDVCLVFVSATSGEAHITVEGEPLVLLSCAYYAHDPLPCVAL